MDMHPVFIPDHMESTVAFLAPSEVASSLLALVPFGDLAPDGAGDGAGDSAGDGAGDGDGADPSTTGTLYHLISVPELLAAESPESGYEVGQHLTFGEGVEGWITPATLGE
jgi:hypothetical protein